MVVTNCYRLLLPSPHGHVISQCLSALPERCSSDLRCPANPPQHQLLSAAWPPPTSSSQSQRAGVSDAMCPHWDLHLPPGGLPQQWQNLGRRSNIMLCHLPNTIVPTAVSIEEVVVAHIFTVFICAVHVGARLQQPAHDRVPRRLFNVGRSLPYNRSVQNATPSEIHASHNRLPGIPWAMSNSPRYANQQVYSVETAVGHCVEQRCRATQICGSSIRK